jgi:peptide subunit release factor RF-3
VKTLTDINTELQLIAQDEQEQVIELQYEEYINEMYQELQLQQNAQNSYDEDAIYYGENY